MSSISQKTTFPCVFFIFPSNISNRGTSSFNKMAGTTKNNVLLEYPGCVTGDQDTSRLFLVDWPHCHFGASGNDCCRTDWLHLVQTLAHSSDLLLPVRSADGPPGRNHNSTALHRNTFINRLVLHVPQRSLYPTTLHKQPCLMPHPQPLHLLFCPF